jgi:hypothetical protein
MRPLRPLLPLLLIALAGCEGSPTDPDLTLVFTEVLVDNTNPKRHDVRLGSDGNLRPRLLTAKLNEPDKPAVDTGVFMGLGQPDSTNACIGTTTVLMIPGDVISFGLREGNYCLTVLPTATLPANSNTTYTLQVEVTE